MKRRTACILDLEILSYLNMVGNFAPGFLEYEQCNLFESSYEICLLVLYSAESEFENICN